MEKKKRTMKKQLFQTDLNQLFTFIDNSPTAYHAAANLGQMLAGEGFLCLE